MYPDWEHTRPVVGVVLTMVAIIVWLVFILLYALFWSGGYNLFQNVVVAIVSFGITGLVIGLGWVLWGFKNVKRWN